MANGLFEDRLKRKKKPGEVDIATLQNNQPWTPPAPRLVEGPLPQTPMSPGEAAIRSRIIDPLKKAPGQAYEAFKGGMQKVFAPQRTEEGERLRRMIAGEEGPAQITPPILAPKATEETPAIPVKVKPGVQEVQDIASTPQLAETRQKGLATADKKLSTVDLQSADVRRRLGIGAPLDITRQDVGYFVGPNTKIMERFDPETGDIRRYIASGIEREQKALPYGATKEEIQRIKEQEQQELEKEKKLWGPRLEAFKAQQDSALRARPSGAPLPKRIDISGNIATDYATGRRWDIGTGQTLTGQQVQIGPGGEKTTTLRFGEQAPVEDLSKERLSSLTSRYNKALEMAGKATTPDERQQYEQIAASMEEQISNITEPRRGQAVRGRLAGGDALQISPPSEQMGAEQQRAPIAAPPWQGLSPTAAMAKRTEVNNKLFQVKDAIESGDESIVRKYFSNPNDNESRYLFSQLSPDERSFIVKRSK